MKHPQTYSDSLQSLLLKIVVLGVAFNGLLIIVSTLVTELFVERRRIGVPDAIIGLPLLLGLTLLYLSSLLARRKRLALIIALPLYGFIVGLGSLRLLTVTHHIHLLNLLSELAVPLFVLAALVLSHKEFTVKSDVRSFALSLRFISLVLLVAFIYGVVGFQLLDRHDFHQQISLGEAVHRTIDQLNITTSHPLLPYTRRARLFLDSLSIISLGALGYGAISLFQPIRARYSGQGAHRTAVRSLLGKYPGSSEDFFKLWPHDKSYFISKTQTAALAYRLTHGVALIVGDPAGDPAAFDDLLGDFDELCYVNDWLPAVIHATPSHRQLYERHDFTLQKIGEEAVVDIAHFRQAVAGNDYFRHIRNKFTKLGYSSELLAPPHDSLVLSRLLAISRDWLLQPGRVERGFMMGYFSIPYLQQCPIMVVRDDKGEIQAFINQITSYDKVEADYDLLRHSAVSPGNINDFLLMGFIDELVRQDYKRLNMGFSPLAGMSEKAENMSLIDSAMRFVYANGDRLYSFHGLYRYKSKYEPRWESRYIAYRVGLRGFTRTLNALNRAMKVRHIPLG